MKRLIITGIPCSSQAWQKLFSEEKDIKQKIIPFIEVFSKNYYNNRKLSDLVPPIAETIQQFKPDQIILHDMGVTIGILALIAARKINSDLNPTIIIFNGAFSGFDVNKSPHPVRIQNMSYENFEQEVQEQGGEVDPHYKEHYPAIQLLYQQITAASRKQIAEKNKNPIEFSPQREEVKIDLGGAVLILASQNDPYIHFECLEILKKILVNSHLQTVNYGHFPYSGNIKLLKIHIDHFQEIQKNESHQSWQKR